MEEAKIRHRKFSEYSIYRIIGFNNEKEGEFVLFKTTNKDEVLPEFTKCITSVEMKDNFKQFYIVKETISKEKFYLNNENFDDIVYEMPEMKKINEAFKVFCKNINKFIGELKNDWN